MQELKALDILIRMNTGGTVLATELDEAIAELEKLQEENEHLKNMLEAYKKDKL